MTDRATHPEHQSGFPPVEIAPIRGHLKSVLIRVTVLLLVPIVVATVAFHRSSVASRFAWGRYQIQTRAASFLDPLAARHVDGQSERGVGADSQLDHVELDDSLPVAKGSTRRRQERFATEYEARALPVVSRVQGGLPLSPGLIWLFGSQRGAARSRSPRIGRRHFKLEV